ncbi:unnamed protein product, partial [Heterosigma akashiwo]
MSRMLDVLEELLALHGHVYLCLDGSTDGQHSGRRCGGWQRLMDRFNADARVFCFVLSTRSSSLGISLTRADTVV